MFRVIACVAILQGAAFAESAKARLEQVALKGEALRLSGKYAEARKLLEGVSNEQDAHHARVELGRIYRLTGEAQLAKGIWNRLFDDYETNNLDKKSARDLMYVAIAGRYLNSIKDANDTFRDAVDADPKGAAGARANVEWAALFLEKYDAGHAEQSLDEALKVLPDDPDAHFYLARVKLEQSELPAAEKEIALALKKNPKHAGALAMRAELLVDDEKYDEALKACDAVFAVNPEDLRGHVIAATAKLLREDVAGFEAERDRVLKVNPLASEFFHGVAEFLVKAHRYPEANQLETKAIEINPKDWVAQAALGSNLLRLGDDVNGVAALQRAWQGDKYNVRTYNLLNLFEDVIPKSYTMVDGTPFRFRLMAKEKPILERYIRTMVTREYGELVKRYGFKPEGPLTIELYANPEHYAVRTVGLPGLEALGVTFGKVITAMSPSLGRFNWGMTLWHEVGHVFSIQLSRSRVPRWFTEGLSEWETANTRPEWTRRTHAELYHAMKEGRLLPVAELNTGFTRARDVAHIVVAYHQSAETVAFLIRRWGFPKAVEALKLYGAGKQTKEVLKTVTGLELPAFDAAFRADLEQRLKVYEGTFFVRDSDFSDVDSLKETLKSHPDDARTKGLYALALIKAHQGEEALKLIEGTMKMITSSLPMAPGPKRNDNYREIALAAGELAMLQKDYKTAKQAFEFLLDSHADGYDARFGLGRIAAAEHDVPEAEKQLGLAKKMDPDRADPYIELAKLLLKTPGREDDALPELEAAARLDCMDPSVAKLLVEKHAARQHWAKVAELAPLAIFIDPFDAPTHARFARALVELNRGSEALPEIDAALECDHDEKLKTELHELEMKAGRI
jgi:tetratricopeptide (TPR) repeat protein